MTERFLCREDQMYIVRVFIVALFFGLFAAQSWIGWQWEGFTHPEHGILVACMVAMGGILGRRWFEA